MILFDPNSTQSHENVQGMSYTLINYYNARIMYNIHSTHLIDSMTFGITCLKYVMFSHWTKTPKSNFSGKEITIYCYIITFVKIILLFHVF